MTYGSLFSGCGGFDLGLEAAGLQCSFQVEIEPKPRSVLERHWPGVPKFNDVRKVGAGRQRGKKCNLPPVDVLVGGFPCQDLSVAGNRGGLKGARSGLFYELVRIARELRPRYLVWENVCGLLSSEDGRDLALVLRHLADSGFHGGFRVLDSQYFGVPQQRRRVFGVFALGHLGAGRCAEILALADGVRGDPPTRQEARPVIAPSVTPGARRASGNRGSEQLVVGSLLAGGNGRGHRIGADEAGAGQLVYGGGDTRGPRSVEATLLAGKQAGTRGDFDSENLVLAFQSKDDGAASALAPTLRAMGYDGSHANGGGQLAVCVTGKVTHSLTSQGADASEDGTGRGTPIVIHADSLGRSGDAFTPSADAEGNVRLRNPGLGIREDGTTYGIMATGQPHGVFQFQERGREGGRAVEVRPDGIANALTSPKGGGRSQERTISDGQTLRRLTPTECERLMGWPDSHTKYMADGTEIKDGPRYEMIGNGVVKPVAAWIGRRLMRCG